MKADRASAGWAATDWTVAGMSLPVGVIGTYARTAATAASPRTQRDTSSSLLLTGAASHTARMIASTRWAKIMSRNGSELRTTGRYHNRAHGTVPSCLVPIIALGPMAN